MASEAKEEAKGFGDVTDDISKGLTREYLAEWHAMLWKRADEIKAMIDASPVAKDLPYKIGYSSDRLIKALIERLTAVEQRAEAAERERDVARNEMRKLTAAIEAKAAQFGIEWRGSAETMLKAVLDASEKQLATERSRHANICAEFEKIATGTHPHYVMRCDVEASQTDQKGDG